MNKNVLKIFLTEDLDQSTLDEALPKDLARAYQKSGISGEARSKSKVDYQAAEYTPLTIEQGKEVWKSDPLSLVLIITDSSGDPRAVRFREDGKVDISSSTGNYRLQLPYDKAYVKRDGTRVYDVYKAKIGHLLNIADKIYKTNDHLTTRDQSLLDTRKLNPESPNNQDVDVYDIKREFKNNRDNQILERGRYLGRILSSSRLSTSRITYDPNTGQASVPGTFGGTGDASYWKDKFVDYFNKWGPADGDTQNAWLAYLSVAGNGKFNLRGPTDQEMKDWFNLKGYSQKDLNARLRYYDTEKILKEPKEKVKRAIHDAKNLESRVAQTQSRKDSFTSAEARSDRESNITYYIDLYKSRLMDILRQLDSYESRLDDLDAADAQQIKKFDDEIDALTKKIADAKKEYTDTMANGAYRNSAFGRRVPESLTEEKSLDELVDILQSRRNENLEEDLVGDEDRLMALAEFLGIDPEEITNDSPEFDTPEGDYLVLTEDEAHDRAVDEIVMSFEDMGLEAFTPQFQEQIVNEFIDTSSIDDFIEQEIDYYQNEEDDSDMLAYLQGLLDPKEYKDKLDYIKSVYGDLKEFIKPEDVDIQAVAEEAIKQDGIAHFISYYDGEENDLGNGYYAYRIN